MMNEPDASAATVGGRTGFTRPIFCLVVVAVLAVGGAVLLRLGSGASSEAARLDRDVTELELLATRAETTRAHLDELTLRLLEPFGLVPAEAPEVTDGQLQPDLTIDELFRGASDAQFDAAPSPRSPTTVVDSLQELVWLDQAAKFTLHETLIAAYVWSPRPASTDTARYFELDGEVVADEGGYLGPTRGAPLSGGWISIDDAIVHEAATVDSIDKIPAATSLWDADQWVRSWAESKEPAEPTTDLVLLADEAQAATTEIRALVDDRLSAVIDERSRAGEAASARALRWRGGGITSFAIAAVGFVVAVLGLWRTSHELHRRVNVDPLTRVGNRNVLDIETSGLLASTQLTNHVVVMVDMDRFKVTNDTYGHTVGDQLLQRLADGLVAIAERMVGVKATVVRLGGDEFVLSLHHPYPIDVARLQHDLDDLRTEQIEVAAEQVIPLAFSYGIATGSGSPNLQQLLDNADLAAYQQKASRAIARQIQPNESVQVLPH